MSPMLPEPGPRSGPPLRIFFALWPDAGARDALSALARDTAAQTGGRAPSAGNLHLTLAFLGDVAAARIAALHALGPAVAAAVPPFTLDARSGRRVRRWRNGMGGRLGTAARPRAAGAVADRRSGEGGIPDRTAGLSPACDAGAALPAPRRRSPHRVNRVARRANHAERVRAHAARAPIPRAWRLASRASGRRRQDVLAPH